MMKEIINFNNAEAKLNSNTISNINIIMLFGCYFGILLVSTLINSGFDSSLLRSLIKIVITTFIICSFIEIKIKTDREELLNALAFVFFVLIIVNFITILVFPNGIYQTAKTHNPCYLLGHKNSMITTLLPGLMFITLYDACNKGKLTKISGIAAVLCIVSLALGKSGGGLVSCLFVSVLIFEVLILKKDKWLSTATTVIVTTLISVGMLFFNFQNNFSFIIENFFGKDATLTSRTTIWALAIEYFKAHPIWGVGHEFWGTIASQITLSETHNFLLGILFHTGIVGVIGWAIIFVIIGKRLEQYRNTLQASVCSCVLGAYLILGLVENICTYGTWTKLFIVFTFFVNIENLVNTQEIEDRKGESIDE